MPFLVAREVGGVQNHAEETRSELRVHRREMFGLSFNEPSHSSLLFRKVITNTYGALALTVIPKTAASQQAALRGSQRRTHWFSAATPGEGLSPRTRL